MKGKLHVIDIELDAPSRMSPAIGQVDRLLKQSLLETQSLQVVRHLLMREQIDKAQTNGHAKLIQAAAIRQEQVVEEPPKPSKPKLGAITRKIEELAKKEIQGPRLNLFILEKLVFKGNWMTGAEIMAALKATGKAAHVQRLSGVFGLLSGEGLAKRDKKQGYRVTEKGVAFARRLRTTLEGNGSLLAGDMYLAPPDYRRPQKQRLGYKTMGKHMKLGKKKP